MLHVKKLAIIRPDKTKQESDLFITTREIFIQGEVYDCLP